MLAELYTDPVAGFVVDLCPEVFQQVDDLPEVDIRADGMGKQGVQRLAVMVIYLCSLIKVARIGWTENAQGAYQPSLIQIKGSETGYTTGLLAGNPGMRRGCRHRTNKW